MRFFLFLCLCFPLLTGWGHWGPQVKIGLALDQNQGKEILVQKLRKELEEARADLLLVDAKGDPAVQEKQVKDLISKGIQALVVLPVDPSKAEPLLEAAHQAGIKVLSLGRLIPGSLDYLIAFNDEKAGELEARSITSLIPKGRYVLLGGGEISTAVPWEGQRKVLQPFIDRGDIKIAASLSLNKPKAAKQLENLLKEKKVDALLASDHEGTEKAIQVLEKTGLSGKIPLAGIGEDLESCRRIYAGTQVVTIYHSPQKLAEETAYLAAKLARKATQFDCQFTEMDNGGNKTFAVLLTPAAVDAKNLDSTIIKDGVQKKEEVYGK